MKKFTLEDKIKCYELTLNWFLNNKNNYLVGICTRLKINYSFVRGRRLDRDVIGNAQFKNVFPEFVLYKPKDAPFCCYWFSSNEERILILKEIINKLKDGTEQHIR